MASKEVRDAIHGLIELQPREWRVVDSPAFQRLRGVQQLAMTHLVYPGARHSRFEHCIGACHVAGRLASQLGMQNGDRDRVRAAALVHDIGHGPFSHVSEFVFEQLTDDQHIHEKISAAIVRHDEPVHRALGEEGSEWIAQLLNGTGHGARRSAVRDIIAGPADIDKLDYLLRDSHYCGVQYGRYDLDKIIESARLVRKTEGAYLAYHRDGVFALEEMLLARYHMQRQVYGHKTRLATDKMLIRAMLLGVEEGLLPQRVFAPTNMDAEFVAEYLEWDDRKTIDTLRNADGSAAAEVAHSLVRRKLLKRIAKITLEDLPQRFDRMLAGEAISPKPDVLRREQEAAEKLVAEVAGVDPRWVVMHWEELQNPISSRDEFRITDNEVLLTGDDTKSLEKFTEMSEVFSGDVGLRSRRSVSVYVRPPEGTDKFDRRTEKAIREAALRALRHVGEAGQAV